MCICSTIASANLCEHSFLVRINEVIRFNKKEFNRRDRLYRNLSVVLKKMASDRSQELTNREISVIITSLEDKGVREIVVEALENNMPQDQKLFLSLFSLLDRLRSLPKIELIHLQTEQAVIKIIVKAFGLDSSVLRLTQLVQYPGVIYKIPEEFTLKHLQMFPLKEVRKYVSELPAYWMRKLPLEYKKAAVQDGIFHLSNERIRALGGLGVFQQENNSVREGIQRLQPQLGPRQLFVLNNRLLSDHPLTLGEIAQRYDVTPSRIQQIEEKIMRQIKRSVYYVRVGR